MIARKFLIFQWVRQWKALKINSSKSSFLPSSTTKATRKSLNSIMKTFFIQLAKLLFLFYYFFQFHIKVDISAIKNKRKKNEANEIKKNVNMSPNIFLCISCFMFCNIKNSKEIFSFFCLTIFLIKSRIIFSLLFKGKRVEFGGVNPAEFWTLYYIYRVYEKGPRSGYSKFPPFPSHNLDSPKQQEISILQRTKIR